MTFWRPVTKTESQFTTFFQKKKETIQKSASNGLLCDPHNVITWQVMADIEP